MWIYDYIQQFRNNSIIYVGDGLVSYHNDKESKVINSDKKLILELSNDEYCINAKNGYYLIANRTKECFYIINNERHIVSNFKVSSISILKFRDIYAYFCDECNSVVFLNFSGEIIFEYKIENYSSLYNVHQLTTDIVFLELAVDFECHDFDNNLHKNIILNISINKVVKQGIQEYDKDKSILCNTTLFDLPKLFKNENRVWSAPEYLTIKIPTIKYTVIEPDYDNNDKVIYHKHVEFCDYLGNVVLRTDYSEISEQTDGYYFAEWQPQGRNNILYGILDESFQEFLPCLYPKLTIKEKQILIEKPNWSDWEDSILDLTSKRFIAKNKKGLSVLLPYTYSSCYEGIKGVDNNLLTAYRYDQEGRCCKGIIDKDGNELLPAIYSNLYALSNNLLEATEYDEDGSVQLIFIEDHSIKLRNKYLKIEEDDYGDDYGDYFRVRVFDKDSEAKIRLGIVDKNGNEIMPPIYDYVFFPREDKINYIKNNIPGWIDLQDESTHEYPRFSVIRPFKNGIALFSKDSVVIKSLSESTQQTGYDYDNDCECYGTFHYDDVCGELQIQYRYTNHTDGLLNTSGRIILEPNYSEIKREYGLDKLIFVKNNYRWGIVNYSGDLVVPFQYNWYDTDIQNFENKDAAFCCGTDSTVDYYDEDAKLLDSEDVKYYERRGSQNCDYEDNYDYDRDTYYALGGYDYDSFRDSGGSIDDMMDEMGL